MKQHLYYLDIQGFGTAFSHMTLVNACNKKREILVSYRTKKIRSPKVTVCPHLQEE